MTADRVRKGWARRVAIALLALTIASMGAASSVVALAPADLFGRADRVVYGVVETSRPLEEGGIEVLLRIERTLGTDPDPDAAGTEVGSASLTLHIGREPGDEAIADLPRPATGDRVLLALRDDDRSLSPVVGFWQGAWTVGPNGFVDVRGRRLVDDGGVLRISAEGVGTATSEVSAVLATLDEALRGGDAVLDDARAEALGDAGATLPLPEVPAPADPDDADEAPTPPREVVLALPEDPELQAALEDALAAWSEAGVPLVLRVDPRASDRVTIRDAASLGDEVRALVRRRADGEGVELLLPPGSRGRRADALAQIVGRLLGLPPTATGFASGLLPREAGAVPDAAAVASLTRRLAAVQGDLDGDGDVDLYDLAAVAEAYGREGIALPADLDGSGRVDAGDVETLRERYEFLPASPRPPVSE